MKDFLFSVALGSAVGGLILSVCNLAVDVAPKVVDWWEQRKDKKNP